MNAVEFASTLLLAEATRVEFMHQGTPAKVAFYVLAAVSTGLLIYGLFGRSRYWMQGKPVQWNWKATAIPHLLKYILGQAKVRSSRPTSGAPMHLLIFYGFFALFIATSLLAVASYGPLIGIPNFHKGWYYKVYEASFDALGLLFVIGVSWAMGRRWGFRLRQMAHDWRDSWALVLLWLLGVGGYVLAAARIKNAPQAVPLWDQVSFVSYGLAQIMPPISDAAYVGIWWSHVILFFLFWALLPQMRLKHIALAIMTAAGKPTQPMGELKPITMEEVEETGQIGVALAKDYSRWHLMSLDACMGCGRCTEVCPAWNVGKVLNPQKVVADIHGALVSGATVAEKVSEEALWACTTCNACVEACPVLIRHVDLIVDARRNLVGEGKLSGGPAVMLRQTQSTANAWGSPAHEREVWMEGLEVPLAREKKHFDVLFWVGCAGATDPGAVKTTKAVAELLNKAGVDYACLGKEEACTGDPARRVGDEFTFQDMAQRNVGTFGQYTFKRMVTACPHCMNTFKNEYHQFGGQFEVVHHTELLEELVASGKLKGAALDGETVFHDPCYLGRVNEISDAPRNLVTKGQLLDPEFARQKTRCCGAGGGRMWMEEDIDQRPGNKRAEQLLATGAKTVALGCPFCRIMLDASIKQVTDEEIKLVDMAELLKVSNS